MFNKSEYMFWFQAIVRLPVLILIFAYVIWILFTEDFIENIPVFTIISLSNLFVFYLIIQNLVYLKSKLKKRDT